MGYDADYGVDIYVDLSNQIEFGIRVGSFGIISDTQSKKKEGNNKINILKEAFKNR